MARFLVALSRLCCLLAWITLANCYTNLTDDSLRAIPGPGGDFDINDGSILAPILIPRVPGTEGSTKVLNHLTDFFKTNLPEWEISFQNSTQQTPVNGGRELPFRNLIVTRRPPWASHGEVGFLTLAAHYDSKLTPEGFIGATDSAAPCAMIMHAARAVDSALSAKWAVMEQQGVGARRDGIAAEHKGVQLLFLDGEEAFQAWSQTDSLYGARSLAEEWEGIAHPLLSTFHNPLDSISMFVLLDLLGTKNPTVPSYFKTSHWAYKSMAGLEERLRSLGIFKTSPNHPAKKDAPTKKETLKKKKSNPGKKAKKSNPSQKSNVNKRKERSFLTQAYKDEDKSQSWYGFIEDDHIPFLERGVEILHIIPTPFPRVWHTMDDDGAHLDPDTVEDWAMLTTAFVAEWMDLEGFMTVGREVPGTQPRDELPSV